MEEPYGPGTAPEQGRRQRVGERRRIGGACRRALILSRRPTGGVRHSRPRPWDRPPAGLRGSAATRVTDPTEPSLAAAWRRSPTPLPRVGAGRRYAATGRPRIRLRQGGNGPGLASGTGQGGVPRRGLRGRPAAPRAPLGYSTPPVGQSGPRGLRKAPKAPFGGDGPRVRWAKVAVAGNLLRTVTVPGNCGPRGPMAARGNISSMARRNMATGPAKRVFRRRIENLRPERTKGIRGGGTWPISWPTWSAQPTALDASLAALVRIDPSLRSGPLLRVQGWRMLPHPPVPLSACPRSARVPIARAPTASFRGGSAAAPTHTIYSGGRTGFAGPYPSGSPRVSHARPYRHDVHSCRGNKAGIIWQRY